MLPDRDDSVERLLDLVEFLVSAVIAVVIVCLVTGCAQPPRGPVAPKPTDVERTTLVDATPRERDLLAKLDLTKVSLDKALVAQKDAESHRAQIAKDLGTAQAMIREREATLLAQIREREAEVTQANLLAKEAADARLEEERQAAALERRITLACAVVGGAAIVGGALAFFWLKSTGAGLALGLGGLALLILSTVLTDLGRQVKWGATAMLIIAVTYAAATAVHRIIINVLTSTHARRQMAHAMRLIVSDDPEERAQGAALMAAASQLEHVASPDYDARTISPPTVATKLILKGV